MKLISLNMEGRKHYEYIKPFLDTECADVVCLQEAPADMCDWLSKHNYQVTFAPMRHQSQNGHHYTEGIILASQHPHTTQTHYYFGSPDHIPTYNPDDRRRNLAHVVILGQVEDFLIATTHLPAPPRGELFYEPLDTDITSLHRYLKTQPPHILCGDMNTPRGINPSHQALVANYTDAVPQTYKSSLDRTLHRLGNEPDKQHLFDTFMVDYLLTQPPYQAQHVRLQFGVSDHAAIVATLMRD
jgi:endonuclease/exonuclease/phosphatase family metal-dependent hydrolase